MSNEKKGEICIPPELIEEILLRLSPYHLSSMKSVCKHWKSLIECPRFMDYYQKHAEETCNYNDQHVSIISDTQTYKIEFYKLATRCLDFTATQNIHPLAKLIGSCNGLLFYIDREGRFLLYNAATHARYVFPDPPPSNGSDPNYGGVLHGFGYDRSTYNYKIVRIIWFWGSSKLQVEVYSMQTKSWKGVDCCIQGSLFGCTCSYHSVFVNDSLHWVVLPCCNQPQGKILRFDVCSEEMSLLPWHIDMEPYVVPTPWLDVLDGCLCAWFPRVDAKIDIWVMKIYGVEESWIKLISIHFDGVSFKEIALSIKLIALSKDGSKLFLAKPKNNLCKDSRVYCYDVITNEKVWEIEMLNFNNERQYELQTSVQSKLTLPLEDLK